MSDSHDPQCMIKEYDDIHGDGVSAQIGMTVAGQQVIRLATQSQSVFDNPGWLDPATARALGAYLVQLADEADARNAYEADVPMVCTECRHGVHRGRLSDPRCWAHNFPQDCSADPVKAMVAEGNANVPR
jgi:hypothetical protein